MSTTLRKCLKVLESIAASEAPRGISELAREINIDKSAVQRIFQTLADEGYIEKINETSRYRPTLRLWELGSKVIAQNESRRLIRPILRYAAKVSELTVYLAWADFPDIIYLDKFEGEKGRSSSSDPGQRIPMHLTASGRAILAFYDQATIDKLFDDIAGSPGAADFDRDELVRGLVATRDRLYAISERGGNSRVNSIAAPIWSNGVLPIGSIVLTSDATTLPPGDFDRIGAIAINAAEQATRVLGGSYPVGEMDAP